MLVSNDAANRLLETSMSQLFDAISRSVGRTAEVASEYLGKGSPILVEGRLKLDTWETEGQKRTWAFGLTDLRQKHERGSFR